MMKLFPYRNKEKIFSHTRKKYVYHTPVCPTTLLQFLATVLATMMP